MPIAALELNDASLAMAGPGDVSLLGPGYAADLDGVLRFGDEACALVRAKPRLAQRRYWAEMAEAPLPQPLARCRSSADLVHEHLAHLWSLCAGADGVVLVGMPEWSAGQLGLLLGIARDIGMPVTGLVDAAVAASRRPCPGRSIWHLQATLENAFITRVGQEGGAARFVARETVERCGIEALERGCAAFIARQFVEGSRFDPLHDAASEQQLYDRLPGWLLVASRAAQAPASMEYAGQRFEARLDESALRERIARLWEPVTQKLRARFSPHEPSVLLVHPRLADFPGLLETLSRLPACTVMLLEPGAAARGALRLGAGNGAEGAVRLTTTLPFDQPPADMGPADASVAAPAPSHIVFEGRAWRLSDGELHIGTGLEADEYGIRISADAAGVSRRHCTIRVESGRVIVHDQSRYGTLLNGHRIEGAAALQAGDVLSLGQPPRQFTLIVEVDRGA